MSGLKNSPFGKRLRAQQPDGDDDAPRRNRPRFNPIFGTSDLSSTPSLDSRPTTSESSGAPESPIEFPRHSRDYGDRFVPTRDGGDMRTSYHLMGPWTGHSFKEKQDNTFGTRRVERCVGVFLTLFRVLTPLSAWQNKPTTFLPTFSTTKYHRRRPNVPSLQRVSQRPPHQPFLQRHLGSACSHTILHLFLTHPPLPVVSTHPTMKPIL